MTNTPASILAAVLAFSIVLSLLAPVGTAADERVEAENLDGEVFWVGQEVAVSGLEPSQPVQLRTAGGDDSSFVREYITDTNGTLVINTSDIRDGQYFLAGGGASGDDAVFDIVTQTLSAEFGPEDDEDETDTDEAATNESEGTQTMLTIAVEDTDGDPLSAATVSINGSEHAVDEDGRVETTLPDGEYTAAVSAAGYEEATATIELDGTETTTTLVVAETPPTTETPTDTETPTETASDSPTTSEPDGQSTPAEAADSATPTEQRDTETAADTDTDDTLSGFTIGMTLAVIAVGIGVARRHSR